MNLPKVAVADKCERFLRAKEMGSEREMKLNDFPTLKWQVYWF